MDRQSKREPPNFRFGAVNNFTITSTEDATAFTESNLAHFQTVVFMSTTGNVLNDSQEAAVEAYIRQGGGYEQVSAVSLWLSSELRNHIPGTFLCLCYSKTDWPR